MKNGSVITLCLSLLLLVVLAASPALAEERLLVDDFAKDLSRWEEKVFNGSNDFRLVDDGSGNQVLQVTSQGSASALIYREDFKLADFPRLSWRWKIERTLPAGDTRSKATDDYAARVYVIFPHFFKPLSRAINYIWANRLAIGEFVPSPYTGRSVMLAVQSGDQRAGEWIVEERNIVEDYRRIFGEEPPANGRIAIMTDTDNTGDSVQAWYDDLQLSGDR